MARYSIDWEKGRENLTQEDYEKIFVETSKIIENKTPEELLPGAFYDRALIYYDRGDYDAAITGFTTAIQLNVPHLYTAYYNRGLSYYAIDKYENSLSDLMETQRLKPDDEDTKEMIEKTKYMLGRTRKG